MSYGDLRGKNSAVDTEHLFEQAPRGCLPFWICKVVFSQYCPPTALGWLLGVPTQGVDLDCYISDGRHSGFS